MQTKRLHQITERFGEIFLFLLLSFLFLALRLVFFTKYGLAQDEILILSQVKTWDFGKIWHYYGWSGQGFFLQHYIFSLLSLGGRFGGENYFRAICLVESYLGFAILYKLAKKYAGFFTALCALFLYAVAPYQILYTLYIRFYALVMTLVIAETYTYFEALSAFTQENYKKAYTNLFLTALFAFLAFSTHQFSIFLLPVFALHFSLFALLRKPSKANAPLFITGLATILLACLTLFFSAALMKKTGLTWSPNQAWLSSHIGQASQKLQQTFFLHSVPFKICSLTFLWLSLGLGITAKITRRKNFWFEIFLAAGLVIPFFLLSHLNFSHFFADRYFAFWFPIWILSISAFAEFPSALLELLRPLQGKEIIWKCAYAVFLCAILSLFFRFNQLKNIRWIEYGNREANAFLEDLAYKKNLSLIYITEPDAASKNYVLPNYYFKVLGHPGEYLDNIKTVLRNGAAYAACPSSMVVWARSDTLLKNYTNIRQEKIGRFQFFIGGPYTNWRQISHDTLRLIPHAAGLLPGLPPNNRGIMDVGTKRAEPHLLMGFSNNEYLSEAENYTWSIGTNMLVRFHNLQTNSYVVAIRARAIKPMNAAFYLNDKKIGNVHFSTYYTNLLLRAEKVPIPEINGAPNLLRIVTDGYMVPGRVKEGVFDERPLSLCFDKLALWPAPSYAKENLAAAKMLETPRTRLKAGAPWEIKLSCANIGVQTWHADGRTPVRLAVRWYDKDGKEVKDERIWLKRGATSGDSFTIQGTVTAPTEPGTYTVLIDFVLENIAFFDNPIKRTIIVLKP